MILAYFKIVRLPNAIMAAIAVYLGYWISSSPLSIIKVTMLTISAIAATGFGNVINDILDIDTDRISHPYRPLPKGEMSIGAAKIYLVFLSILSITLSCFVSLKHGIATVLPLGALIIYSRFLKGTPIAGNLIVASLVAYPILYGGFGAPHFSKLFAPSILAFLLNISREIIKDLQDQAGDQAAGYRTTASIPKNVLRVFIFISSILYGIFLAVTIITHQFGLIYTCICLILALPVHGMRTLLLTKNNWSNNYSRISGLFKLEMMIGLIALAADHLFSSFV